MFGLGPGKIHLLEDLVRVEYDLPNSHRHVLI